MRLIKKIFKFLGGGLILLIVIQLTRGYLFVKNDLELKAWHRASSEPEMDYSEYQDIRTFLKEERIFLEERYSEVEDGKNGIFNRYIRDSESSPITKTGEDVNSSFEMVPEDIRGGVLLIHGLTDSPYTMRDLAKIYYERGYYVLCIRYPYHGTYPGELLQLHWTDFMEATRFGARMVKKRIEGIEGAKFYMVGYSTGATASLQYITRDMIDDEGLPRPEGVFWLSPAMGVSPAAKYGFLDIAVSKIPGFEKFAWLDIYPEYDPAKYNSFAKNPGIQVYNLIREARENLSKLTEDAREGLPPIYAYSSIEDATVDASQLVSVLKEVGNKEGELIIFDANRKYNDFYKPEIQVVDFSKSIRESGIISDIVVVSNYGNRFTDEVSVIRYSDGVYTEERKENRLRWSEFTFSLAHVSLPIAPENPMYGRESLLGKLNIKGEKGIVALSTNMLVRLRYNEFFDYIRENMEEKID